MFKHVLHRFILLAFLWVPLAASADEDFGSIVIFGDSLSDNGNLAAVPGFGFLTSPLLPFDAGFSNGPRAVEVLADGLGLPAEPSLYLTSPTGPVGTNFAVASARTMTLDPTFPIDLPNQLEAFLLSVGDAAPPDALYVVFIGGNDIRDARGPDELGVIPDDAAAADIIAEAVAGVEVALETLAGAGAQTILLANAPDVGAIPESAMLAPLFGGQKFLKRATKLTRSFNKQLKKAARRVEKDFDVDIVRFNTFRFFDKVQRKGEKLGFTNTEDACFLTDTFLTTGMAVYHPDCNFGLNFDSFVFFDEIHPTAEVHRLAGEKMAEIVDDWN